MRYDCDRCQRPLIAKKAYEKLDELAADNQLIVCFDCKQDLPEAKVINVAGGAYLIEN